MTTPHPMFVSIFRAYGVAPTEDEEHRPGRYICMRCCLPTDNEDDLCDDCAAEGRKQMGLCPMCGVDPERHSHCDAPCPFDECPFKENK